MTALSPARSPLSANLICMASMLIWAAALPAAEVLIRADPAPLPPILLNAARMIMAAAFLRPVWWLVEGGETLRRARPGPRRRRSRPQGTGHHRARRSPRRQPVDRAGGRA